jgi:hippurate hydrolase
MVHNPGSDVHDGNLAIGSAFWALLVQRYLHE